MSQEFSLEISENLPVAAPAALPMASPTCRFCKFFFYNFSLKKLTSRSGAAVIRAIEDTRKRSTASDCDIFDSGMRKT